MAVGIAAALNVGVKAATGNINNVGDFFSAAVVGGLAGAAGFGAGQFVSGFTGSLGFIGGAATGAGGGLAGGFVGGAGDVWANGGSFSDGLNAGLKGAAAGAVTGAALGGVTGGIRSVKHGGNFWSGKGAVFASHIPDGLVDEGLSDPLDYNTETAREFSDEHFGDLSFRDKVQLHADGRTGTPNYYREGDFFINAKTGEKAGGLTIFKGYNHQEVRFAKTAFTSARKLYLYMGHEYIHAGFNIHAKFGSGKQHASILKWEKAVNRRWGLGLSRIVNYHESIYTAPYDKTYSLKSLGFDLLNIPMID